MTSPVSRVLLLVAISATLWPADVVSINPSHPCIATFFNPSFSINIRDVDLRETERPGLILILKDAIVSTSWTILAPGEARREAEKVVGEAEEECNKAMVLDALTAGSTSGAKPAPSKALSVPPNFARAAGGWISGDWNRDGAIDTAFLFGNTVLIQIDRDGVLDRGVLLRYSNDSSFIAGVTGDFTGDNIQDLVLCCAGAGANRTYSLIRGDGRGSFSATATALMAGAQSLHAVDWNADGKLDLAGLTPANEAFIALGNGDGTFQTPRRSAALTRPYLAMAADVNRDNRPDLIVLTEAQAIVLPSAADFSFGAPIASALPTQDANGNRFALAGDWNADGRVDLAAQNNGAELLTVLYGDGTGRFPNSSLMRGGDARGFTATIPGGTGGALFLVPDPSSGSLMFFPVAGGGKFEVNGPQLLRLPDEGSNSLGRPMGGVGNLNNDRRADAVLVDGASLNGATSLRVQVFPGTATLAGITRQTLPAMVRTNVTGDFPRPVGVHIRDFNADGNADVLVPDGSRSPGVHLLRGDGRAGLSTAITTPLPLTVRCSTVADINGDGTADAVLGAYTFGSPGELQVLLGSPSGLQAPTRIAIGNFQPQAVASGDINGDGRADVVLVAQDVNSFASNMRVYLGTGASGAAAFSTPTIINLGSSSFAASVTIANIDSDPLPEVLVGGSGLFVFRNTRGTLAGVDNGAAGFAGGAASILVNDFDGDGKADLMLATCCGETSNYVHIGRGDGTFASRLAGPPMESNAMFLGDFNGDGAPDFAQLFNSGMVIHPALRRNFATTANGASFRGAAIAPATIAAVFGPNLATETISATAAGQTNLGGSTVTLTDRSGGVWPCPLFFVSPNQVNFYVPAGVAPGPATVYAQGPTGGAQGAIEIVPVAPGIFLGGATQALVGAITRLRNGEVTNEVITGVPIDLGPEGDLVVLTIYATGLRNRSSQTQVRVSFAVPGNSLAPILSVPVDYAGAQGGFDGLDQVNVTLPRSLAGRGALEVTVVADSIASNGANIVVR